MLRKALFGSVVILASVFAEAQSPFNNIQKIITTDNFTRYYDLKPVQKVKIAIFDSAFYGYEADQGKYLPAKVQFTKGTADTVNDTHGKYMAEIIYALMTNEGRALQFAPDFYFYTVNSFTDFQNAITDAIQNNVQIISMSAVKDFGSNWDGRGFWNHEVDRATAAGIIWLNNAGNLARLTFNSTIAFHQNPNPNSKDTFVTLPDANNSLSFICERPEGCNANIFLTWNDFKDDSTIGTNKDLDLLLIDSSNQKVRESSLEQVVTKHDEQQSIYPREHISGNLKAGTYYLMVKSPDISKFAGGDQMRITVDGENIRLNHYDVSESILNPADDATVITVGALDSDRTGVSLKLKKPELVTNSTIKMGNEEYAGSSNSTAIVAAGFGILKSLKPSMTRQELLRATSSDPSLMNSVFSLPQPN